MSIPIISALGNVQRGTDGPVYKLIKDPARDVIYASGAFGSANGIARSSLAAFDLKLNLLPPHWQVMTIDGTSFEFTGNGTVYGLDISYPYLFIGGLYNSINGQDGVNTAYSQLAKNHGQVAANGEAYNFNYELVCPLAGVAVPDPPDDTVYGCAITHTPAHRIDFPDYWGTLIIGTFANCGAVSRPQIALLKNLKVDTSFAPGSGFTGGRPMDLIFVPGSPWKVYVCGAFTSYNGTSIAAHMLLIKDDATIDGGFDYTKVCDGDVKCFAKTSGGLFIGGIFDHYDGTARGAVALLHDAGTLDTSFNPAFGVNRPTSAGDVRAVATYTGGKYLVGGDFDTYDKVPRKGLCRVNGDGTLDDDFVNPRITGGAVEDLLVLADNTIVVAGAFTSVKGHSRRGICRLDSEGSLIS